MAEFSLQKTAKNSKRVRGRPLPKAHPANAITTVVVEGKPTPGEATEKNLL